MELCAPSNDAMLRKWNVKYHFEPVNVACCIMKKKKWQLFRYVGGTLLQNFNKEY